MHNILVPTHISVCGYRGLEDVSRPLFSCIKKANKETIY